MIDPVPPDVGDGRRWQRSERELRSLAGAPAQSVRTMAAR
jgi:hypothetical protein